jgi:ABC-type multidrug transport system ATPase subunit
MEASITLKNVSKSFKNYHLFSNLNIGVEKGSTFAILGKNGAGKTVLLKLMATWMLPDSGTIYIRGEVVDKNDDYLRQIAYLPDCDAHDPWLTGWQNILFRAQLLGLSEAEARMTAEPLIAMFNLQDKLEEYPVTYSRGAKRCLDLVMTLMQPAEIYLLDEPLAVLDYQCRWALLRHLLTIKAEKTIVIATSLFTELQTIADRWIILDEGRVRFDGTLEKMLSKLELPFNVEILLCRENQQILNQIKGIEGVVAIESLGHTIQIALSSATTLPNLLQQLDLNDIAGIKGQIISIEEFINRLLTEVGGEQ